jgi:hypothetical protein
MATQTEVVHPTVAVSAQNHPERPVVQSEVKLDPAKEQANEQPQETLKEKEKVRRIIDEEGPNTTASVQSPSRGHSDQG